MFVAFLVGSISDYVARLGLLVQKRFIFSGGTAKTTVELTVRNKTPHLVILVGKFERNKRICSEALSGEGRFRNNDKLEVIKLAGKERRVSRFGELGGKKRRASSFDRIGAKK